mmetsp:Transcript_4404/g.13970  ORF Transcript_4404/g.13970 Transcript_4404/m.13970 type:complete len:959 (-) Transcript_4404:401-3277(-)
MLNLLLASAAFFGSGAGAGDHLFLDGRLAPRARRRSRRRIDAQRHALVLDDERGDVAGVELAGEDRPGERRLERFRDEALERARAVRGVEAAQRELLDGVGRDGERDLVRGVEARGDGRDLEPHNVGEHALPERVEDDDLVEAVQEFGAELGAHRVEDLALDLRELGRAGRAAGRVGGGEVRDGVQDQLRADVGREEDDGVAEAHRLPLAVGQDAVVEQLKERVEDVRVRLLHLVEENDAVGPVPHGLGELTALVVADVAGRRAEEARHGVLLRVLGHVEAQQRAGVVVDLLRQRLGEFRLAHARRAEERKGGDGLGRVAEARFAAPDRVGDEVDRVGLADDARRQRVLEVEELVALRGHEPRSCDARHRRDDGRDVVGRDGVARDERVAAAGLQRLLGGRQPPLELGHLGVADLRRALQVEVRLEALGLGELGRDGLLELADAPDAVALRAPRGFEARALVVDLRDLPVELGDARGVVLGRARRLDERRRQAHLLHLQLDHAPVRGVERGRARRHLVVQLGRGLVDDVDGLVGQEPRGHVAVREPRGRDERRVEHADAVVRLELRLEAPQDGHGRLDVGLGDDDFLEPPLERLVGLDVLLVLGQRRRADAPELAARERRLQQVGRVERAAGRARADDRVDLVDEQDHVPRRGRDLVDDRLEPLLELAAVLGAGDEQAHVQRNDRPALERLGHRAAHDALRQALGDGRLADAGLADEARVVLGPPAQDLDRPLDLVVAPDHGVQLARLGQLRQVAAVLVERVRRRLRRPRVDRLVAPELVDRRAERRGGRAARGLEERPARGRRMEREAQHLVRAVLVAERRSRLERLLHDRLRARPEARLARARNRREGPGLVLDELFQRLVVRRRLAEPQRAVEQPVAVLAEDRAQQVLGLDDAAASLGRRLRRALERLPGPLREAFRSELVRRHAARGLAASPRREDARRLERSRRRRQRGEENG